MVERPLDIPTPADEAIPQFEGSLRGPLHRPDDEGYDEARTVWNGMIDSHPALIVQCAGTAGVINTVAFAKEHDYPISVRGGGHNIAGRAVEDETPESTRRYVRENQEQLEYILKLDPGGLALGNAGEKPVQGQV